MRILFLCKQGAAYGFTDSYMRKSSGLFNSTQFIVHGLKERGIHAKVVEVTDNNDIDREVTEFNPSIVVIEALWVVPWKFDVLKKLHPQVKWFCHLHSHTPFLAIEGIAIEWIFAYSLSGVKFITNSVESTEALEAILPKECFVFLPNVYLRPHKAPHIYKGGDSIHIGCFGAIRPFKNQLIQAISAIRFAKQIGAALYFHINASRVETGGDPVLKNIRALFDQEESAVLVECPWMDPEHFHHYLEDIDVGMQVSLSETFNIVTADYVSAGLPVVVSKEISWVSCFSKAPDNSVDSIVKILQRTYKSKMLVKHNQKLLLSYSEKAQAMWNEFVRNA